MRAMRCPSSGSCVSTAVRLVSDPEPRSRASPRAMPTLAPAPPRPHPHQQPRNVRPDFRPNPGIPSRRSASKEDGDSSPAMTRVASDFANQFALACVRLRQWRIFKHGRTADGSQAFCGGQGHLRWPGTATQCSRRCRGVCLCRKPRRRRLTPGWTGRLALFAATTASRFSASRRFAFVAAAVPSQRPAPQTLRPQ